ncbi:MAG: hypothetical protein QM608_13475 [Caulobacter sp.]
MTPGPELRAALDAAYDVFARYGRPSALEAPPHRKPEALLAALTAKPLREAPCEAVGRYAGWATTTVGGIEDYKHFLPRVMELAVGGKCPHMGCEPEILGGRIAYAGLATWPARERAAVTAVFEAAARQAIDETLDAATPEEWLTAVGELGVAVAPLLQAWLSARSVDAGLHLAEAVRSEAARRADGRDDLAQRPPEARAVRLWLRGSAVRERLEALLFEVPEDETWRVEAALIESEAAG